MRLRVIKDVLICSEFMKGFENEVLPFVPVFCKSIKLTVRKSAGSALSEAYIGIF